MFVANGAHNELVNMVVRHVVTGLHGLITQLWLTKGVGPADELCWHYAAGCTKEDEQIVCKCGACEKGTFLVEYISKGRARRENALNLNKI